MDDTGALGEGKKVYLVNVWVEEVGKRENMIGMELGGEMIETDDGCGRQTHIEDTLTEGFVGGWNI